MRFRCSSLPPLLGVLVLAGCGGGTGDGNAEQTATETEGKAVVDKTLDKIALVRRAAAKRTAYGRVSGVFCQVADGPCVVTYLLDDAPTCQVWAVRTTNGVLRPMPAGEPYYPADPGARGCD